MDRSGRVSSKWWVILYCGITRGWEMTTSRQVHSTCSGQNRQARESNCLKVCFLMTCNKCHVSMIMLGQISKNIMLTTRIQHYTFFWNLPSNLSIRNLGTPYSKWANFIRWKFHIYIEYQNLLKLLTPSLMDYIGNIGNSMWLDQKTDVGLFYAM